MVWRSTRAKRTKIRLQQGNFSTTYELEGLENRLDRFGQIAKHLQQRQPPGGRWENKCSEFSINAKRGGIGNRCIARGSGELESSLPAELQTLTC
jgi:hypothetical protein